MKSFIFVLLLICPMNSVLSADLDPFLSLNVVLEDSAEAVNAKTTAYFQQAIAQVNRRLVPRTCEQAVMEMVMKIYKKSRGKESLVHWMSYSGELDAFPAKGDLTDEEYEDLLNRNNIWREAKTFGAIFDRLKVPYMDGVINVGGYYIGPDKINHALGLGIVYYAYNHLLLRKRHLSEEAKVEKILRFGYLSERHFIGMGLGQLLSYGDLEANWQGFKLYQSMCAGDHPRIQKNQHGKWALVRAIDWREYVNEDMDELYNPNGMYDHPARVARFHSLVQAKYCTDTFLKSKIMRDRWNFYRHSPRAPSENQRWIRQEMAAGRIVDNHRHRLENICRAKAQFVE